MVTCQKSGNTTNYDKNQSNCMYVLCNTFLKKQCWRYRRPSSCTRKWLPWIHILPPKLESLILLKTRQSDQFSKKYEISINISSFHKAEKMFLVIHRPGKGMKHSPRSSVTISITIPCLQNLVKCWGKTCPRFRFHQRILPEPYLWQPLRPRIVGRVLAGNGVEMIE